MSWDSIKSDSARLLTYQDFVDAGEENREAFALEAIRRHMASESYQIAVDADLYDAQKNPTINKYVQQIFDITGSKLVDFTASNNKIACNFFHRLNTQRVMYSLGNGVSFIDNSEAGHKDTTKERLGKHFDHDMQMLAYKALTHGVSFAFWNIDRMCVFPLTEFAPLWDEQTGTLRAGIRFWRLDPTRPMQVVLYEEDGWSRFQTVQSSNGASSERLVMTSEKRPYITHFAYTRADMDPQVIAAENYSALPVVPMWGSKLHQSTLVGMREKIDSYDLIRSGFANDLQDCAQIYWMIANAGGMTDQDMQRFLDRLKINHVALVDSEDGGSAQGFTQEIPYEARKEYLNMIRAGIYEDFGALDVHTVAAGATNDHIDAAYQPMDEEAADFEYQVSEFIQQLLALMGIDDQPVFKRTRISNQLEQVQMIVAESDYLDRETILRKLPNVSADEVPAILDRLDAQEQDMTEITPRAIVTDDGDDIDNEEIENE
jgi:hypothetical protein